MRVLNAVVLLATITAGASHAPLMAAVAKHRASSPGTSKMAKLRSALHRNLDGKGGGFIASWSWRGDAFTLTIDPAFYSENKFAATAMAIRAMFESNGVSLPRRFVVRDVTGATLADGSFSNVPSLVE